MLTENLVALLDQTLRQKVEGQPLEVKAAVDGCPTRLYDMLSAFSSFASPETP